MPSAEENANQLQLNLQSANLSIIGKFVPFEGSYSCLSTVDSCDNVTMTMLTYPLQSFQVPDFP